jgi:hypothetical protein
VIYTNAYSPHDPISMWASPILWILGILGGIAWIIIAIGIVFEKADTMERSERIALLYGYTVCLIAIIVFLISVNGVVSSAFELSNPLASGGWPYAYGAGDLSSFEAYKATYLRGLPGEKPPPALSDDDLRAQYEAVRSSRIADARFEATKSLTTSLILLIVAVVLFVTHWRWLKNRAIVAAS